MAETADQVSAVVRSCARHGVPFVARGSGTGLSGGALPHSEGVLVVMSRMRDIVEIDTGEVALFWDCTPREASRRAHALREDLNRMELEEFLEQWSGEDPPAG